MIGHKILGVLPLFFVLFGVTIRCSSGLNFTYEDLKQINGSCHIKSFCQTNQTNLVNQTSLVSCFCDSACIEYGDCCLQAKAYNQTKMVAALGKYQCVNVNLFRSFYMKAKCKKDWTLKAVEELCLNGSNLQPHQDPFIYIPVTRNATNTTYRNYYCAACNDEDYSDLHPWQTKVSCNDVVNVSESYIKEQLHFTNGGWGININNSEGVQKFHSCSILPQIPDSLLPKVRRCENYISKCSLNWTDPDTESLCHSYTNIVYDLHNRNAYRNIHCATCNFIPVKSLECKREIVLYSSKPVSLSVLFDFGKKDNTCEKGRIFDPFSKLCRPVVCQKENYEFRQGRCVKVSESIIASVNATTDIEHSNQNTTEISIPHGERNWTTCDKMVINETDFFKLPNETVFVNLTAMIYRKGEYEIHDDGIVVCIPESYSSIMGYLTLAGLAVSSASLLVHLAIFIVTADLNNLSDKNLASLCISLFASYVCFLMATYRKAGAEEGCQMLASIMYYFLLSSFMWMNVMSFDVWRALRKAIYKLRVTSGEQWKKFLYYSLYAWTLPGVALTVVLLLDNKKPNFMNQSLLPALGETMCWFGESNAILIYFAAPLAIILTMNVAFFALAVRTLAITANHRCTLSATQPSQVQLKLYVKLAILMGVSWVSGIVAGFFQNEYVWCLFILLNAFQGLFILIAFTCTPKVWKNINVRVETVRKISTASSQAFISYTDNNSNCSSASAESQHSRSTSKSSVVSM